MSFICYGGKQWCLLIFGRKVDSERLSTSVIKSGSETPLLFLIQLFHHHQPYPSKLMYKSCLDYGLHHVEVWVQTRWTR